MNNIKRNIYIKDTSYAVSVQSKAENVFERWNIKIFGSNSILGMIVCFASMSVLSSVCSFHSG
jgi:hypothetical protein